MIYLSLTNYSNVESEHNLIEELLDSIPNLKPLRSANRFHEYYFRSNRTKNRFAINLQPLSLICSFENRARDTIDVKYDVQLPQMMQIISQYEKGYQPDYIYDVSQIMDFQGNRRRSTYASDRSYVSQFFA